MANIAYAHLSGSQSSANGSTKPIAIAPKVALNPAHVIPVVPLSATEGSGTVFLAPCDNNGQIATHFVLTAAGSLNGDKLALVPPSLLLAPGTLSIKVVMYSFAFSFIYLFYFYIMLVAITNELKKKSGFVSV